ncbi:MAG: hypothetical protein M1817_002585 [Caeruleum heppii]|nr:MAG: hypothetical protein M1817_002585 [Caeruleum heppii]
MNSPQRRPLPQHHVPAPGPVAAPFLHSQSEASLRSSLSSSSDDSSSSPPTTPAFVAKSPYTPDQDGQPSRPALTPVAHSHSNTPNSSVTQNFSRPSITPIPSHEQQLARNKSPLGHQPLPTQSHQPPQHAQGFFEPSLPTASGPNSQSGMAGLTASQIAAQAAMQLQASQQHLRKRSQTIPNPQSPVEKPTGRRKPNSPPPLQTNNSANGAILGQTYQQMIGNDTNAAATAANAAYPRSALSSPGLPPSPGQIPPLPDRDVKTKPEKSKMKLFSKPKSIGISKDKDIEKKDRGLPSPNRLGILGPAQLPRMGMVNASSTSLADSIATTSNGSIYGIANSSTATLVPSNDRAVPSEKHKHHFLSRQKHKLKDKNEHHQLPLSSASSNSKPLDPNAPQSLYSFTPSAPAQSSTSFTKSVSGLDLRHGGRALREKKKEEKASAAASAVNQTISLDSDGPEWPGTASLGPSQMGLHPGLYASSNATAYATIYGEIPGQSGLQGFGLPGMTPDDAWPFLKAKILIIFEGEDLRLPVEDFNRLVTAHIQRCIQQRAPSTILEDLNELLITGFSSLDQTLRHVPDSQLVRRLVDMWLVVFGTTLPYMQAVFLPLDLEFKGVGPLMSTREAKEFWGALPPGEGVGSTIDTNGADGVGPNGRDRDTSVGDTLDVRRIVLITFRDTIITPRHDVLKKLFSRLSLESIDGGIITSPTVNPHGGYSSLDNDHVVGGRPSTAMSLDPGMASFNSQSSTLLGGDSAASGSASVSGARSRAASNTSSAFGGTTSSHGDTGGSPSPRRGMPRTPAYPPPPPPPPPLFSASSTSAHTTSHHSSYPLPSSTTMTGSSNPNANSNSGAKVTETVGRMLQCISVLSSIQSRTSSSSLSSTSTSTSFSTTTSPPFLPDDPQLKLEELARTLKLNWLGRGRTGRNRRGFVGARVVQSPAVPVLSSMAEMGDGSGGLLGRRKEDGEYLRARAGSDGLVPGDSDVDADGRGGSPTPTPSLGVAGSGREVLV